MSSQPRPQFTDLEAALARIRPHVNLTPVLSCESLDEGFSARFVFKCENLQVTGSFKDRGACHSVLSLDSAVASRGVVTHSSGNHAAALARAARIRGIPAHIVMPENAPPNKLAAVRRFGVTPVTCLPTPESRRETAEQLRLETGATLVHPYDDPRQIAGQGTVALEFLRQTPTLDILLVPVGGGGLLSGSLLAVKALSPQTRVFGVEPEIADDAYRSLRSGTIEPPLRFDTIADGLRTPIGRLTFPIIQDLVDDILRVKETTIAAATRIFLNEVRIVVEPSGAVGMAAVMEQPSLFKGKRVGIILSGGNLDWDRRKKEKKLKKGR